MNACLGGDEWLRFLDAELEAEADARVVAHDLGAVRVGPASPELAGPALLRDRESSSASEPRP
jgi:hypothetical protein